MDGMLTVDTRTIWDNLLVLFALVPCLFGAWWSMVRLVNWSTGVNIREVMDLINSTPLSAAVYRAAVLLSLVQLASSAFDRWV